MYTGTETKLDFYRAEVSKEFGLSAEANCRLIRCRLPRFSQTQLPLKAAGEEEWFILGSRTSDSKTSVCQHIISDI